MRLPGIGAACGAAILLVFTVAPLEAQRPERQGWWAGIGIGGSSSRLTCQVCSADRATGISGYVQAGGTASPQVRFGLEGGFWWRDEIELQQSVASLGLVGYFHPSRAGGLFFKAGPSGLRYTADDGDDEVTSRSYGLLVGLGYEVDTQGSFVFTPALTVHASSFGRLQDGDATIARDVNLSLIQLSIGVASR